MTHKKRCAVYVRTATDTIQLEGTAKQQLICRGFIAQHDDWVLVEKEYNDSCVGGHNLNKPALNRLLHDSEKGEIDIIVMRDITRLWRGDSFRGYDIGDFLIYKFQQQGTDVIFVEDHFLKDARISTQRSNAPAS